MEFWEFQGFFAILFFALTLSMPDKEKLEFQYNIISKVMGGIILLAVVFVIIGSIISAKIFNAGRYSSLIDIKDTKFEETVKQTARLSCRI